ncbi:hypothetical protein H0H93_006306 [Arthromyces matolae]|nr:hypothetical protein H0H93_006306 [Arthromyces matolae]
MIGSERGSRSAGTSPLRPVYSGSASYKIDNMSVADDLHPVIHKGRVAVITGAASGIGMAAAFEFAKLGLKVAIADVAEDKLNKVAELLIQQIGTANVLVVPTDVSQIEQVIRLKDRVYETWGEVAVLMNNAGIGAKGTSWEGLDTWHKVFNVNLFGVLNVQQTFVPAMLHQENQAMIINTGSKQGITNPPGNAAYNASKAAVKSLTEGLAHELYTRQNSNVTAHLFVPGWTWTGMTEGDSSVKPSGAWTAEETVLYMLDNVRSGDFYILVPDNETKREVDQFRIMWGAGDIVENRPALSRWHPNYKALFEEYMREGLSQPPFAMSLQGETPFQIAITDTQLSLLGQKLALSTFPDELDDAAWHYGVPLANMKRLVNHWKNGFDWRKQEAALNAELPQFTRDIEVDGHGIFNVHYVHKTSQVKAAIPLIFVHGYSNRLINSKGPGSFIEVRKLLPILTEASSDHPSFHVVAISLPGYGFSTGPTKQGFQIPQYAEVAHKLMLALGYNEYGEFFAYLTIHKLNRIDAAVTQGGDWGQRITRRMAEVYGPEHSKAWHTNYVPSGPPTIGQPLLWLRHALSGFPFLSYSQREQEGTERTAWFSRWGRGYNVEQSTRPQTLGYGLADSPVGLLAWIYEKLVEWTDGYEWDDDEVLTWISIYWFSRAGPAASLRIYYEATKAAGGADLRSVVVHTTIPLGHSYFPKELAIYPRSWTHRPNLVFEAEHDKGGHFAAHEQPRALADDLRKMFGKGGPAFGVVKDKNGYDS